MSTQQSSAQGEQTASGPAFEYVEGPPAKKKRGPKPKPKPYVPRKPVQRLERRYTIEKKREVLMFLEHHRIKNREGQPIRIRGGEERLEGDYRRPTLDEASEWFKIPFGTIHNWWKNRDSIFDPENKGKRTRRKRDASGNLVPRDQHEPDAPAPAPAQTPTQGEMPAQQVDPSIPHEVPTTHSNSPGGRDLAGQSDSSSTPREPSQQRESPAQRDSPIQRASSTRPGSSNQPDSPDGHRSDATVAEEGSSSSTAAAEEKRTTDDKGGTPQPGAAPAAGIDAPSSTTETPSPAPTAEPSPTPSEPTATATNMQDADGQDAAGPLTRTTPPPPTVGARRVVSLQGLLAAQPPEPSR